jgi:hypothetical protein
MKTFTIAAALGAALVLPSAAFAADAGQQLASGHYEWREVPHFGPRAAGPMRKRFWVPDTPTASCDCPIMKADINGCMHGAAVSSAG